MNIASAEAKIGQAVNFALSKGFTIVDDCYGSAAYKCCSPIGALLIHQIGDWVISSNTLELLYDSAGRVFSDFSEINSFSDGFSKYPIHDSQIQEWYNLGLKFRDKFNPIKHFRFIDPETGEGYAEPLFP